MEEKKYEEYPWVEVYVDARTREVIKTVGPIGPVGLGDRAFVTPVQ
jgi:hypothetical protein